MLFDLFLALGAVTLIVVGLAFLWRSIKKYQDRPFIEDANYDETYDARRAWWD